MATRTGTGYQAADTSNVRLLGDKRPILAHVLVHVFVIIPFIALGIAIP